MRLETWRSPYFQYCVWIAIATTLYGLHWSTLFAPLRMDTAVFVGLGFCAFFTLSVFDSKPLRYHDAVASLQSATIAIISVYYFAAYANNGGIPFVQLLMGQSYDIYGFGIPYLHVVMLSLSSYYTVRCFRVYSVTKSRTALAYSIWLLALIASLASRSALSFVFFSCFVLYLRNSTIRPRSMLLIGTVFIAFLVAFGKVGDIRLNHQITADTGQTAAANAIARYARASESFYESGLPAFWLWPYMYLASPLANLNEALRHANSDICGETCSFGGFLLYEWIPDMIGARLAQALGVEAFDKSNFLIAPDLTASTTFGSAVGYAGILGAYAMLLWLIIVSISTNRLLRRSRVREEGVSILAAILFFSFFENMISYTPMSLQLVFAIVRSKVSVKYL